MDKDYILSKQLIELLNKAKTKIKPDSCLISTMLSFIEKIFEYQKWIKEIPPIPFKEEWLVKIIPPFGGAIVRFLIAHKDNPERYISVYLDCYNTLGFCTDVPYWEVFPVNNDNYRIAFKDVEELVNVIDIALK